MQIEFNTTVNVTIQHISFLNTESLKYVNVLECFIST